MKKFMVLSVAAALTLALAGCGKPAESGNDATNVAESNVAIESPDAGADNALVVDNTLNAANESVLGGNEAAAEEAGNAANAN